MYYNKTQYSYSENEIDICVKETQFSKIKFVITLAMIGIVVSCGVLAYYAHLALSAI